MGKRKKSFAASASGGLPPLVDGDAMPTFVLDLDLSPRERWAPIGAAFRGRFASMLRANPGIADALEAVEAFAPSKVLRRWLEAEAEVEALAVHLGQPAQLIAALQVVYEVFALTELLDGGVCGCTAACFDCNDGAVHGRTLDWSLLRGLDALLLELDVRRGGAPLCRLAGTLSPAVREHTSLGRGPAPSALMPAPLAFTPAGTAPPPSSASSAC